MDKELYDVHDMHTIDNIKEARFSSTIAWIVSIPFLTNTLGVIMHFLGMGTDATTYLIYLFVVGITYKNLCLSRNVFLKSILLQLILLALFFIQYVFKPEYKVYYVENNVELMFLTLIYVPGGCMLLKLMDYRVLFEKLRPLAVVTPFVGVISFYFLDISSMINYMVFSTMMLPGTLICAYYCFQEEKIFNQYTVMLVCDIFMLLINGGRMGFLSAIAYVCLMLWRKIQHKSFRTKIILFMVAVILAILIFVAQDVLENLMITILTPYREQSRIIDTIVKGKFFSSTEANGRSTVIYPAAREALSEMGLRINGFFGDRVELSRLMSTVGYKTNYAHNFYYEALLSFGWVIGSILSVWVTWRIVRSMFAQDDTVFYLCSYFMCLEFMRLLVSGSFLVEGVFVLFFCSLFIRKRVINYE